MQDYKLIYESSGAGTSVYLCTEKKSGIVRVVKKYRSDLLSSSQQKMVNASARLSFPLPTQVVVGNVCCHLEKDVLPLWRPGRDDTHATYVGAQRPVSW